jgi:FKBP-type peptidyl-prolyl cis-trans isomerase FklB
MDQWLANAGYVDEGKTEATEDYAAYHVANGARKGVVTTESGLQYKVVQKGLKNGATPVGSQRVEMHYHGFFPDGSVFDSSIDRDETMTHNANGFILGWNESLADMKVCEARVLYIPGDIAYGPRGRGQIPPNATLLFHMQLLGVKQ